jgi:maltose O-acetyltransferase
LDIFRIKQRLRLYLLVRRGLKLGKNVFVHYNAHIDESTPHLIEIGDCCTLTNGVIILSHDASTKNHLDFTKVGKVIIGKKTFIGVNSVILPNVTIGSNVVIGAGSVVTHDIPDYCVAVGNPARVVCGLDVFLRKHSELQSKMKENYVR